MLVAMETMNYHFGSESSLTIKMATRKLTVGNIVAAVFDSNFGFSDSDSSRKKDGEDIYADRGDTAIE